MPKLLIRLKIILPKLLVVKDDVAHMYVTFASIKGDADAIRFETAKNLPPS